MPNHIRLTLCVQPLKEQNASKSLKPPSKIPHPNYVSSPLKRKATSSPEPENSADGDATVAAAATAPPPAKKLILPAKGAANATRATAASVARSRQPTATAAVKPAQPERLIKRPVRAGVAAATTASKATAAKSVAVADAGQGNGSSSTSTGNAPPKSKKRPAWDTKGRLQDMEETTATLQKRFETTDALNKDFAAKLEQETSRVQELENFRASLQEQVQIKQQENADIAHKVRELQSELDMSKREHEHAMQILVASHKTELARLEQERARLDQLSANLARDLQTANDSIAHFQSVVSKMKLNEVEGESRMRALESKLASAEATIESQRQMIATRDDQIQQQADRIAHLEHKSNEDETVRRKLHNTIQELKGNIRVFCRVRPLLEKEMTDGGAAALDHITFADEGDAGAIELAETRESADGTRAVAKSYSFTFDKFPRNKVFQPATTQAKVFEEISQLVQSALDGYNVCIFAYGQTGSGKTFTMEGGSGEVVEQSSGMIPRAVSQIYQTAQQLQEKGWSYDMEGQFMEIYNEQIRDLLGDGSAEKKHEIRHAGTKTSVTDMTSVPLKDASSVQSMLKKASKNRAVAATNMNERSSRSHSVFILTLTGKNSATGEVCEGRINLVDLAGSERLTSSGSTGDRLKETQAINKSLSCLGDVIQALANKDNHIPYRNSKLTFLLQNSLGGNSKTLMFVNISPLAASFNESLNSLRFATKVNNCQIGTAKRTVK
ncbi:kinesin-like nuclear fusion protein [Sorochytrium milnesiophthora]